MIDRYSTQSACSTRARKSSSPNTCSPVSAGPPAISPQASHLASRRSIRPRRRLPSVHGAHPLVRADQLARPADAQLVLGEATRGVIGDLKQTEEAHTTAASQQPSRHPITFLHPTSSFGTFSGPPSGDRATAPTSSTEP